MKKSCTEIIFCQKFWSREKDLGLYILQDLAFTELPETFVEPYEVSKNGLERWQK